MNVGLKGYSDLADLPEDKRIEVIGIAVTVKRETVAVALENEEKKIVRYERKLKSRYPGLLAIERASGLVPNTILLLVSPMPPQNIRGN